MDVWLELKSMAAASLQSRYVGHRRSFKWAVVLLVFVASGCAPFGYRQQQMERSLIGLPALAMRTCTPVPVATELHGNSEVVFYRWIPDVAPVTIRRELFPSELERNRERRDFLLSAERPQHSKK